MKRLDWSRMWSLLALGMLSVACNAHPITPIDANLNSVDRINNRLAAKTKLDFLFVVDNSGSMCQEQERLADNFRQFSGFLFDELQGAADYRIAVVNTDLGNVGAPPERGHKPGELIYMPAMGAQPCQGVEFMPNTYDCEPPGAASAIISSTEIEARTDAQLPPGQSRDEQLKAELERQFRCRATLGTGGGAVEKGLEAMRLALSCRGPNAELFSPCCVNPGTDSAYYNPACTPSRNAEPQFLRPDATLVVIFITDEDDCSTPSDSPLETSRLICRANGMSDANGDGIPDVYAEFCPNPSECYMRECGQFTALGPQACFEERCEISGAIKICDAKRGALTSVREYKDFLYGLKARPFDQLFVAPLVGFRTYTDLGNPHRYAEGSQPFLECSDSSSAIYGTDSCCPMGTCIGFSSPIESCRIPDQNVLAYGGARYLELADLLGANALGCPVGQEPIYDPVTGGFISNSECINLCSDDLGVPLTAIKERVSKLVNTYCLDRSPPCVISDPNGTRLCENQEELYNPAHYNLSVKISCLGGGCDVGVTGRTLTPSDWTLNINDSGCPAKIILNELPPAGSEVIIEFISTSDALIGAP